VPSETGFVSENLERALLGVGDRVAVVSHVRLDLLDRPISRAARGGPASRYRRQSESKPGQRSAKRRGCAHDRFETTIRAQAKHDRVVQAVNQPRSRC
jgi:hypothetical protein